MKYRIVSLDVWGNKKDGYEINAAYNTDNFIDIEENDTAKDIKQKLFNIDYLSKTGMRMKIEESDLSDQRVIYLVLTAKKYGNMPFIELHLKD